MDVKKNFFSKIWKKISKISKFSKNLWFFFQIFEKKIFFRHPKWIMLMLWLKYNQFFQVEKIDFFGQKLVYLLLNAQNGSICIRMHQNVCRMNCANVLCSKISKKWFLLHLNRLKLKNYLWLFVMEDPVHINTYLWKYFCVHIKRIYRNYLKRFIVNKEIMLKF